MIQALFYAGALLAGLLLSALAAALLGDPELGGLRLSHVLYVVAVVVVALGAAGPRVLRNALSIATAIAGVLGGVALVYIFLAQVLYVGTAMAVKHGRLAFLWNIPPTPADETGGIGPALLGTLYMTAIGAFFGFLIGFPVGVYLGEFRRELAAKVARIGVNVLVEFPTITIGLLVYALLSLLGIRPFSGYAGALALAIIMIPYVALFTAAAYASIPQAVKEAAYAVTGSLYKSLFIVMRKVAARAILAAFLLGTAKIAGETAPLLFTAFGNDYYTSEIFGVDLGQPTSSLTLLIYYMAQTPYTVQNEVAWGAAAVLLWIILAIFAVARLAQRTK